MLYHFELNFSDIDRNIYESLDFRVMQHPSETGLYLLTRTLAYALAHQENLEFSPSGLGDPETPALLAKNAMGSIDLWIEIGNPSAKKLHKASKAAKQVMVYTYKNADLLIKEISENSVHRAQEIQIFSFDQKFLKSLEDSLKKNNRWTVLHQQGQLDIDTGDKNISSDIKHFYL